MGWWGLVSNLLHVNGGYLKKSNGKIGNGNSDRGRIFGGIGHIPSRKYRAYHPVADCEFFCDIV
jgi:hypothetical protein